MSISGKLGPTGNEVELMQRWFQESSSLQGDSVRIQLISNFNLDLYNDPDYTFDDFIDIDVILDRKPDLEILRSLGWYVEDSETLPILAYIPHKFFDEVEDISLNSIIGTVVEIPHILEDEPRLYEVSNVKSHSLVPVHWVCKLTPIREGYENPTATEEGFYNHLNINEE